MAFCAALALPLLLVRQQAKSLLATLGLMALPLAGIAAVGLQFYFYDLGWLLLLLMR